MLIRRKEATKEVIGGVSVKVSKVWRKIQSRVGMYYIHKKDLLLWKEGQQVRDVASLLCSFVLHYFTWVWGFSFVLFFLAPVQQPPVQAHCRAVCVIPQKSVSLSMSDVDHSSYRIQALVCKYFKICCLYTFVQYLTQSCSGTGRI